MGALANDVRGFIEKELEVRGKALAEEALARKLESEQVDVTLPGAHRELGHKHPMTSLLDEVKEIFIGMGFEIIEGPEVETTFYNFPALNTRRTTRPASRRTPSTSPPTSCSAPRPRRCRRDIWRRTSLPSA